MSEGFEPKNDLEQQLLAAQEGRMASELFLAQLLSSQVFMPVRDEDKIGGFQRDTRAIPLSLQSENGAQVVVLFSSPERAKRFVKDFPGYQGGLLTEMSWILQKIGTGYGILLNPGWEVGFELEPDTVAELADLGRGKPH